MSSRVVPVLSSVCCVLVMRCLMCQMYHTCKRLSERSTGHSIYTPELPLVGLAGSASCALDTSVCNKLSRHKRDEEHHELAHWDGKSNRYAGGALILPRKCKAGPQAPPMLTRSTHGIIVCSRSSVRCLPEKKFDVVACTGVRVCELCRRMLGLVPLTKLEHGTCVDDSFYGCSHM